eukprot:CAMPEP_0174257746 /NCGR_PEP_ID=MMETSP0439-20130205/6861_1 /TAXON_ID=0 /ORGANISM="Stereomyxa ramosa, Strain Chinc5" /LENGTH=274 /DNA_ID=CAMNT_0015340983 /DNA_START=116 /DNA_END=940 /DNA_ORIENTATION=-
MKISNSSLQLDEVKGLKFNVISSIRKWESIVLPSVAFHRVLFDLSSDEEKITLLVTVKEVDNNTITKRSIENEETVDEETQQKDHFQESTEKFEEKKKEFDEKFVSTEKPVEAQTAPPSSDGTFKIIQIRKILRSDLTCPVCLATGSVPQSQDCYLGPMDFCKCCRLTGEMVTFKHRRCTGNYPYTSCIEYDNYSDCVSDLESCTQAENNVKPWQCGTCAEYNTVETKDYTNSTEVVFSVIETDPDFVLFSQLEQLVASSHLRTLPVTKYVPHN